MQNNDNQRNVMLSQIICYLSAFGNSQANDLVTEHLLKTVISCIVRTVQDNRFLLFLNHLRLANSILESFALLLNIHLARYSFATTITLANNVKLENVSKMLGHTNTRMTLHYAHIMNESLAQEMNKVAEIMG